MNNNNHKKVRNSKIIINKIKIHRKNKKRIKYNY